MKHGNIQIKSISDYTGTYVPSAGPNGTLGRYALLSDVATLLNAVISLSANFSNSLVLYTPLTTTASISSDLNSSINYISTNVFTLSGDVTHIKYDIAAISGSYTPLTITADISSGLHSRITSIESEYLTNTSFNSLISLYTPLVTTSNISSNLQSQIDSLSASFNNTITSVVSGSLYTNTTPTPSQVGGIEAGSTFLSKTVAEMFDLLLYPYQYPAFSSFTISGQSSTLEVGASIASNRTFTWATTNSSNVTPNSISIIDQTNSNTVLASGLSNDGSELVTMSAITKTSATNNIFRIQATNTKSQTIQSTYTVNWRWRLYYGVSSNSGPLVESDIESLSNSSLVAGYAGTFVFGATNYKYFCYPAIFGTATTFKDQSTNLDVAMQPLYTVSVTNSFGQNTLYKVHRTTNIIGSAITIVVS